LRENIMATRTRDCKTFHFLIKKKKKPKQKNKEDRSKGTYTTLM